jgi:hypothetical protein
VFGVILAGAAALRAEPAYAQRESTGGASGAAGTQPTSKPHVVLLAATEDDPLAARLAGELEALGLDVTRRQIDPTLHIEEMVRVALAGGARGVVVADGRRTEFWVAEEGSDRVAMRQELETEVSPSMESVLSLRTVEFLRVSLGLAGHAVTRPPEPPPPPKPREADQRVAFNLHAGAVGSTGELAPFATVGAALRVRVAGPVGFELRGLAPLGSQQLTGTVGPIDTTVWLAGGGLVLAPRTAARVAFDVGAGALTAVVRVAGTANPAFVGQTDYAVGAAVYGRVACRVRLSPSWSLRLDVLGGSTVPLRPVIAGSTGGGDVTTWGLGFVAGVAGVEAGF